jgi:hypothetical protein
MSAPNSNQNLQNRKKHIYNIRTNCSEENIKNALGLYQISNSQIEKIELDIESNSGTITFSSQETCQRVPSRILIQGYQVRNSIYHLHSKHFKDTHNKRKRVSEQYE